MSDADLCTACYTYPPETPGMWICTRCADQLHGWLADIAGRPGRAGLAAELEVEITKQSRKGRSVGHSPSTEPPLPYSPEASDCLAAIRNELVGACRLVALDQRDLLPADTIEAMCAWLTEHETSLGMRAGVGDVVVRLGDVVGQAHRLVDIPPERRYYLGTCDACERPMRTAKDQGEYRCCTEVYDIEQRLAGMTDRLTDPDNRMTLSEIAVVTGLSLPALSMRVKRGKIEPVMGEGKGAWYRLGDVS